MTYDTIFRQHACILIALTQKTNLNQVLAIFCQIDGFNRADIFVQRKRPEPKYKKSILQANAGRETFI